MSEESPRDVVRHAIEGGHLGADEAARLRKDLSLSQPRLRDLLVDLARERAHPPVSGFRVGAVVEALDGSCHLGANLEFEGNPLSETVHAEQAAVSQAWLAGAEGIAALAVSAVPCGHCRQFLLELGAPGLRIEVRGRPVTSLATLIPDPFGPEALCVAESPWHAGVQRGAAARSSDVISAAREVARRSYAPYSKVKSGVAFELTDGAIIIGGTFESAAFNPSLGAIRSGLVNLAFSGRASGEVVRAVFAESHGTADRHGGSARLWATLSSVALERVDI